MPITKVPITHKFGIISQTQREELQERLLQQVTSSASFISLTQHATRNPLELSDSFIHKFNSATSLDEKEPLEDVAIKLLARAKRRTGLTDGGHGSHVDLPKAWSELSMLAQCRGKIQEECLDTLIVSLHQAPLSRTHIPCLFYLGETTLYWLRTDAMNQPFLRIGEIKLLKMGQTVFVRLFYHHMVGHLRGHSEFKERLATYLSGFSDSEEAYGPYPGAHLCLKYIISVGKMIAGTLLENVSEKPLSADAQTTDTNIKNSTQKQTSDANGSPTSLPNSVMNLEEHHSKHQHKGNPPSNNPDLPIESPFQSSIHDLSPSLWHALDVWRCVDHLADGFKDAVEALALCASRLATEHWVDAGCAIKVVGEAALSNMTVLRALQNLAKGKIPPPKVIPLPSGVLTEPHVNIDDDELENEKEIPQSQDISRVSQESLDSMEIKFEEMLGIRDSHVDGSGANTRLTKKLSAVSNPSAQKGFSRQSQMKSTRNTSMCVMIDSPQDGHAESLLSAGSAANKPSPDASSAMSFPEISSRESQLDSASAMINWGQRLPSDVQEDDEDSDLAPGDDSFVSPRQEDVTKMAVKAKSPSKLNPIEQPGSLIPSPENKLKREVSFDLEVNQASVDDPKRKSSLREPSVHADKSPSAKSVVIDPVPSTTFYSEPSDGISDKGVTAGKMAIVQNKQVLDQRGITSWPWEAAYIYTEVITNICLYGKTSDIKKVALIGNRRKDNPVHSDSLRNGKLSAGLLDLAELGADSQDNQCWFVRYAAISGLIKISRCFQGDQTMDGMRTVVWNALMVRHSKEADERVLEAFRVGQVEAQVECEMQKAIIKYPLNFRLAAGLASNYLPPLPPSVSPVKRTHRQKVELPTRRELSRKGPHRPSLRDELKLATSIQKPQISFNSRTDLDLKRIVEDQWRKDLHEQLEAEEKDRQNQLMEEQKTLEVGQKERDARKAEKFKKKKSAVKSDH